MLSTRLQVLRALHSPLQATCNGLRLRLPNLRLVPDLKGLPSFFFALGLTPLSARNRCYLPQKRFFRRCKGLLCALRLRSLERLQKGLHDRVQAFLLIEIQPESAPPSFDRLQ